VLGGGRWWCVEARWDADAIDVHAGLATGALVVRGSALGQLAPPEGADLAVRGSALGQLAPPFLAGEVVEGVAGEEVGGEAAAGFPVAAEVGAVGDADALGGTEVFEIGDAGGVGGAALVPVGRVYGVAGLASAEEGVAAVFPVGVVDEADGDGAADAEGFGEGGTGIGEFFEGAGEDDAVEMGFGEGAHEGHHIGLMGVDAAADAGGDFIEVEVYADGVDVGGVVEVFEEEAAAAAEIEDAGVGGDPLGDDLHVHGAFEGGFGHGCRVRHFNSKDGGARGVMTARNEWPQKAQKAQNRSADFWGGGAFLSHERILKG
jgi:hypothetical protein